MKPGGGVGGGFSGFGVLNGLGEEVLRGVVGEVEGWLEMR